VIALTILNEVILRSLGVDEMRPMFYGAILIISILFLPDGLESLLPKIKGWLAGRKDKRAVAEQPAE
jgi:branched-chain amino acid transport system permease protein